jgi:hypothetical protein
VSALNGAADKTQRPKFKSKALDDLSKLLDADCRNQPSNRTTTAEHGTQFAAQHGMNLAEDKTIQNG